MEGIQMHMADALISPAVGRTMWAVAAGALVCSAYKVRQELDEKKVPMMGVLGAFVFAAQMINFTIPGTGSSGHLGGGLILAALLGPYAAFLTMVSILTVQALFFADGGLLALGCNIVNLGWMSCFIAYPLIYKPFMRQPSQRKIFWGAMIAAVSALQLGSLGVVLETWISGVSQLPPGLFALLMQPIHLAIGIVEGLITAAVISFVWKARPEIVERTVSGEPYGPISLRPVLTGLLIAALVIGGGLSWFASTHPDGLEWSIFHASGQEELETEGGIYQTLARWQEKIAFLPDYGFRQSPKADESVQVETAAWPSVNGGTTVSGLVGGALTLMMAVILGLGIQWCKRRSA